MINEQSLIGLPLQEATKLCEAEGLVVAKIAYAAPKPLENAMDDRVIRATQQNNKMQLVYSAFLTDIDI